jgi:hypothetical protein
MELRRRKIRELGSVDGVEQIDQRRRGEPRLGAASPGGEHAYAPSPRGIDPSLPERRLPDPRPACEHKRAWRSARIQEGFQRC